MKAGSRLAQPKSKCAKEIGKVKPPTYGQMQQQQQQQQQLWEEKSAQAETRSKHSKKQKNRETLFF